MDFEWDPHKATADARKHGVEFVEAMTIFAESPTLTIPKTSSDS